MIPARRSPAPTPLAATAVAAVLAVASAAPGPAGTLGPAPLGAQDVVGTAVDAADGSPIAGAFVVLVDGSGEERARGLTTASGTFRLTAPPGSYRLSLERIGFEEVTTEPLTLSADERVSRVLEVPARPVELSEIRVAGGEPRCGTPSDEAAELSRVWAEASKALEATVWTDRQSYYRFDVLLVRQTLDTDAEPVAPAEFEPIRIYGRHPFRAVRPDDLRFGGWVQPQGARGLKFFAPDADVLLSPSFLSRHCFRLVTSGAADGLVGMEFEPLPGSHLPDIEGVLWVDRETAELLEMEYGYTNLDLVVDSDRIGGRVVFDHLPDGGWIVQSWEIVTPALLAGAGDRPDERGTRHVLQREGQRVLAVWRTGDLQAAPGIELPVEVAPVHAPPDEILERYPAPEEFDDADSIDG